MKPNVMFLRTACFLPDGLDLTQKRFSEAWMSVEETTSAALDVKVRSAGWNFIWLKDVCSRSLLPKRKPWQSLRRSLEL